MAIRRHLPLEERLALLRTADQFRHWSSLDDDRVCILCERKFNGRQVDISHGRGRRVRLHCPTDGCNAGPSQWVYPGNPLISETAYADWQRALENTEAESSSAELSSAA